MSDLISKQVVIDAVNRLSLGETDAVRLAMRIVDYLISMSSAQPERKNGKWIVRDNPGTGWYRVTCSECGEDVTSVIPMIGFFPNCEPLWDFCPYCGSDMRMGTESEPTMEEFMYGQDMGNPEDGSL